jgi:hypothetical protein
VCRRSCLCSVTTAASTLAAGGLESGVRYARWAAFGVGLTPVYASGLRRRCEGHRPPRRGLPVEIQHRPPDDPRSPPDGSPADHTNGPLAGSASAIAPFAGASASKPTRGVRKGPHKRAFCFKAFGRDRVLPTFLRTRRPWPENRSGQAVLSPGGRGASDAWLVLEGRSSWSAPRGARWREVALAGSGINGVLSPSLPPGRHHSDAAPVKGPLRPFSHVVATMSPQLAS